MFGKKKGAEAQAKDFHCTTCGLDCKDQAILDRHMSWAHKETATAGTGETKKS